MTVVEIKVISKFKVLVLILIILFVVKTDRDFFPIVSRKNSAKAKQEQNPVAVIA